MTTIKLDGKPSSHAADALHPHANALYATPGARRIGIVELAHVERTEPAPDEDKERSVKLRISHLEIAGTEQEDLLRQAMRALKLHRTAYGTLDEDGQMQLSDSTLRLAGESLHALEAARLRATLAHWETYIRRVQSNHRLTHTEIRHELDAIATGLGAMLAPIAVD